MQATPFTDEAFETIIVCLEGRKVVGRRTRMSFFAVFAATLQVSTCHLCTWGPCAGVCQGMALIGDAK